MIASYYLQKFYRVGMANEIQRQDASRDTVSREFFRQHTPQDMPADHAAKWLLGALNDSATRVIEFHQGNVLKPATGVVMALGTKIGFVTTMVAQQYLAFALTWHLSGSDYWNHRVFAVPHAIGHRLMYLILQHLKLPKLEEAELIKSAFGGNLPNQELTHEPKAP